ncbi:serine/threonine-protein kinase [Isoptericola sp. b441]|uniref:non-specific serine/threonine protein kinase n=1 Tax=Actinotalea lenta TaxID=3064654 RepID=A0ABT9DB60_9CELL|nr:MULTISPECIES: serine/threonine-protein kinase [unclassified Isoptericola]MDO8108138.1 serine/threonine-protein kinase [Isoptericola sp. b441]MDO8120192.1 serine/threonine-protein kinase [Isoptericola sp. b490]
MHRLERGFTLAARYLLADRIAAGGMGEVWEAFDTRLQRDVAIKVMHPSTADEVTFARRFRDEALHAGKLSHVNIAAVFDYGEHDGLAFLVMELVRGVTLAELLRLDGALPPDEARSVLGQTALALAVAHEAGIVHRDVKPANILVDHDGVVKLTDFGIARAVHGLSLTRTGEILGTPYYLSPEQALGAEATPASDVYALGVVAHESLTGAKPFDGGTPIATALAHVKDPAPPLPSTVPGDLSELVTECLSKEPTMRPASARRIALRLGLEPPQAPHGLAEITNHRTSEANRTEPETVADQRTHDTKRVAWYWVPISAVAALLAVSLAALALR